MSKSVMVSLHVGDDKCLTTQFEINIEYLGYNDEEWAELSDDLKRDAVAEYVSEITWTEYKELVSA